MNTKHNGFTIVELLIVIVVIAILAAITLVSYNGIRDRAYNTAMVQAASSALKIINITHASSGVIQLGDGVPHDGVGFCIGDPSDFPADSNFGSGECHTNSGNKGFWASQELWDILSQYGSGNLSTRSWY
ncbi:MAG: prepilin-type N-terminal cleavage/methylation domain-containing protein, partial [bacterium]|nr:prepilin-type N-terminal cleavage/methylation domain-containing protein [bacterium]